MKGIRVRGGTFEYHAKEENTGMKISFFGAAQEVGRSCMLINAGKTKILLDAGLGNNNEQVNGTDGGMRMPELPDGLLKSVDGIFITHAHLDHCCFVAHAYARGYRGNVYATKPTIEIMKLQIADYVRISKPKEITREVLKRLNRSYKVVEYRKQMRFKNIGIEFVNAGHIIGSSLIQIAYGGKSLLYTGDLNLRSTFILNGADLNGLKADALVMESTYGAEGDIYPEGSERGDAMIKSINETILSGGKVLIPSFGVGRAQEVLLLIRSAMESGRLQKVPIYADGSIGKIMRIHRQNLKYCRKGARKSVQSDSNIKFVDRKDRERIVKEGSCIIVSTSGMMKGGPIIFYMQRLAEDPANKLIIVGYQAEGTQGREILDGSREVEFEGKKLTIRMQVEQHRVMAHADRKSLEELPGKIRGLKQIFIVHGEAGKQVSLEKHLELKYKVSVPGIGETHVI